VQSSRRGVHIWRRVLLGAAVGLVSLLAWIGWPPPKDKLVFRPVSDAPRLLRPRIAHGNVVNAAADYPASFYAEYDKPCSGTMIGRDTILMAAHCLFNDGPTVIAGQWGEIEATCRRHPKYVPPSEYDVALCRAKATIPITGYEQIVRPPFHLGASAPIQVTGWGETARTALGQWFVRLKFRLGLAGHFRVGKAIGAEKGPIIVALGEMTPNGRIELEHGDSGGAAYVGPDATRRIVGINSCGGPGCGQPGNQPIVLASLADEQAATFIDAWANESHAHICGRDSSNDRGCRN